MTNAAFMDKWQARVRHTSSDRLAVRREELERLVALASRTVSRSNASDAAKAEARKSWRK